MIRQHVSNAQVDITNIWVSVILCALLDITAVCYCVSPVAAYVSNVWTVRIAHCVDQIPSRVVFSVSVMNLVAGSMMLAVICVKDAKI